MTHQVVSSLGQPMSNAEFVASFSQERNRSFNTAVGVTTVPDRNTIPACVYGAQSVTDGQAVRLRLLEPMAVADRIIPRNAVVVGAAKIQGERLGIEITSLEHDGTVIPVELEVYDTDGQPGIFIPNSMEMNAVREVAANMGGSLGSSINISTKCRGRSSPPTWARADTRHEPVHCQEDAHRQSASESRVQGHALSGEELMYNHKKSNQ